MEEVFSLAGLIGSALRVFWRLALLVLIIWFASRRSPYRYVLMHRGHGLAAIMFSFASLAVLRWASDLSDLAARNATPVILGLGVAGLALVAWGLALIARTEPGADRRVAVGFLLLSALPVVALLLFAFPGPVAAQERSLFDPATLPTRPAGAPPHQVR